MARTIVTPDTKIRIKRSLQKALGLALRVATFVTIAVVGGLASSWYVVSNGAAFNSERIGPWVKWTLAGRLDADPYSLVRGDRLGMLVQLDLCLAL